MKVLAPQTLSSDAPRGETYVASTGEEVRIVHYVKDVIDISESQARALRDALNDILGE